MTSPREYLVERIAELEKPDQDNKPMFSQGFIFRDVIKQELEQALTKLDEAIAEIEALPNVSIEPIPHCVERPDVLEILKGKSEK